MVRFRRSGRNWEGRPWSTSPALNALMDEIEEAYPDPHRGDGTVASKTHDATSPASDHRPYPYTGAGVVNAVDAGENVEDDGWTLAEAIRVTRDPRVRYVQHEAAIFSSYSTAQRRAWEWGPVGGNPHVDHVHVSVLRDKQHDGRLWNLGLGDDMTPEEARKIIREELDRRIDGRTGTPNGFLGVAQSVVSVGIGATGPAGVPPPWTVGEYLRRTYDRANVILASTATDEDIDLLVGLIQELPADVVDEIAKRLALPQPR